MTILKCKMCGGDIKITGEGHGICQNCDCEVTLPRIDDDKRADFYNRGNYFRQKGDFDRAYSAFEHIIADDMQDAEAHWSLVLCRYGVEYVQDPRSGEYMPTVSRMSYSPVLEDPDYLKALEYSDAYAQGIYRTEAQKIAKIQDEYIVISRKEKPYDVFVCFKADDERGQRTQGSIVAQDIYEELTENGVRTFFSRVTLRNIAGEKYEPYIFAALNSAKVMLVVTSNADHLRARWVRNEWARFLNMKDKDPSKILIPVCKGVSPYDLPAEIQNCGQCIDASVLGYKVNLKKRILSLLGRSEQTATSGSTDVRKVTTATLLKRVQQTLEDGNYEEAKQYCGRVLDLDPENSWAYLYLYFMDEQITDISMLDESRIHPKNRNLIRARQYADSELKMRLDRLCIDKERLEIYNSAMKCYQSGKFRETINHLKRIPNYRDSSDRIRICEEKLAERQAKRQALDSAVKQFWQDMGGNENYLYEKIRGNNAAVFEEYKRLGAKADKCWSRFEHGGWLRTIVVGIVALFFWACVSNWFEGVSFVDWVLNSANEGRFLLGFYCWLIFAELFLFVVLRLGAAITWLGDLTSGCLWLVILWSGAVIGSACGLCFLWGEYRSEPFMVYVHMGMAGISTLRLALMLYLGIKEKLWYSACWKRNRYFTNQVLPLFENEVDDMLKKYSSTLGREETCKQIKQLVDRIPEPYAAKVKSKMYPKLGYKEPKE